ncbi:MAG: hypothetical protein LBI42_07140 [Chitinispirillales bacterium]|nr:hypothetical protein [Chitinispirillales bacterium]
MLFIWITLLVLAFLGAVILVFYLTIELTELEKITRELSEDIKKHYGH